MSIIPGNNITITAAQIVSSTSNLIIRTPTANSSDTLDTASNIILAFYGLNDNTYDGDSFSLQIYNNSTFTITLNSGTGITMFPVSIDQIAPQTSRIYSFVKTSGSTMDMYLDSSGTAYNQSGLNLANNRVFVGNSNNIATDVAMTGDISIINTGATSLIATTNSTLTTLGGLTTALSLSSIGTITTGTWNGGLILGQYGGTGVNNGTNTLTLAGNLATSGAFASTFTMTGATAVTFPTSGTLATTTGVVTSVSGTTNRITSTGGTTPVIDISAAYVGQSSITTLGTITTGVWNGTLISPTFGGTGVNNATRTLTLAGNLATSGAFASTFTMTGATAVTFPTTGTLATTSQLPTPAALTKTDDTNVTLTLGGTPATALLQATSITAGWTGQLSLTRGGTNASLTASNGGIFYSTATAGAILAGTATARQMLQSGASTTPAWSTATWPATTTINRLLYSSATNTVGEVTTANSAVLVTSSTGVPTYSSTMTNGQVIIGSTGATPVAASLTAGANITITPGAGTITIASSAGTVPLFRAYGPSAAITPGAFPVAYTTLTTYNAPTFDAGTYSYAAGVATILVAGVYEVCFTVQFNSNGNTGSQIGNFQGRIIQNGASVAGSITECNMARIAGTNNRTHCTKAWIITAALNDTVAIQYAETTTNTVFQVTQNESVFTIKRLQ